MAHLSEQATNTMLAIGLNKISVYKNRNRNHGPCDEETFLHDEKLVNKILDHLECNPYFVLGNSKSLAPRQDQLCPIYWFKTTRASSTSLSLSPASILNILSKLKIKLLRKMTMLGLSRVSISA